MTVTPASRAPMVLGIDDLPAFTRHPFGLFTSADVQGPANGYWAGGVETDDYCPVGLPHITNIDCEPRLFSGSGSRRHFRPPALDSGDCCDGREFPAKDVYVGKECLLANKDHTVVLVMAAMAAAEQAVAENMLAGEVKVYGTDAGTVMHTAFAGDEQFSDAALALEHLLAAWYSTHPGVTPTIHMSPDMGVNLRESLVRVGVHLELVTGERVVIGTGYSADNPLRSANGAVLFATGPVFVKYTPAETVEDYTKKTTNKVTALVRRTYVVGFRCDAMYVQFTSKFEDREDAAAITGVVPTFYSGSMDFANDAQGVFGILGSYRMPVVPPGGDADTTVLAWLNADPVIGTSGTNKPTDAWANREQISVQYVDENGVVRSAAYSWDGTKWVGAFTVAATTIAPGDTVYADTISGITQDDLDHWNGGHFNQPRFIAANPNTAWTTGQKATIGDTDVHWDGHKWVVGAAT